MPGSSQHRAKYQQPPDHRITPENLERAIKAHKHTRRQAADAIGTAEGTVFRWVNGRGTPRSGMYARAVLRYIAGGLLIEERARKEGGEADIEPIEIEE